MSVSNKLVFVPDNPFVPSLRVRSEPTFHDIPLALPKNIRLGCQGQTLQLITTFVNYSRKKVYNYHWAHHPIPLGIT